MFSAFQHGASQHASHRLPDHDHDSDPDPDRDPDHDRDPDRNPDRDHDHDPDRDRSRRCFLPLSMTVSRPLDLQGVEFPLPRVEVRCDSRSAQSALTIPPSARTHWSRATR